MSYPYPQQPGPPRPPGGGYPGYPPQQQQPPQQPGAMPMPPGQAPRGPPGMGAPMQPPRGPMGPPAPGGYPPQQQQPPMPPHAGGMPPQQPPQPGMMAPRPPMPGMPMPGGVPVPRPPSMPGMPQQPGAPVAPRPPMPGMPMPGAAPSPVGVPRGPVMPPVPGGPQPPYGARPPGSPLPPAPRAPPSPMPPGIVPPSPGGMTMGPPGSPRGGAFPMPSPGGVVPPQQPLSRPGSSAAGPPAGVPRPPFPPSAPGTHTMGGAAPLTCTAPPSPGARPPMPPGPGGIYAPPQPQQPLPPQHPGAGMPPMMPGAPRPPGSPRPPMMPPAGPPRPPMPGAAGGMPGMPPPPSPTMGGAAPRPPFPGAASPRPPVPMMAPPAGPGGSMGGMAPPPPHPMQQPPMQQMQQQQQPGMPMPPPPHQPGQPPSRPGSAVGIGLGMIPSPVPFGQQGPGGPSPPPSAYGGMPPPPGQGGYPSKGPGAYGPPPGAGPSPYGMPPPPPGGMMPPGGGYPPQSGMGQPAYTPQAPPPATPSSRVDPAQIPRPVEGSELVHYRTVAHGEKTPPAVTRKFVAVDDGNCSPRFLRATTYYMPVNQELAQQTKLPLAILCRPYGSPEEGEEPIPSVDYGEAGPIRCTRCKAYINCFAQFVENGAKWCCNICGLVNELPRGYECQLDAYGHRRDRELRPEFSKGSVDFVVGKDYCVRPPQEPIYVFALDASPTGVESGMLPAALDAIRANVESLPGGDKVRVGLLTFASKVHFYRLPPPDKSEEPPAIFVLGDVDDPFSALPPDQWILNDKGRFLQLLDRVPELLKQEQGGAQGGQEGMASVREEAASVAAVEAAADALSTLGGRIFLFTASRPTRGAGALRLRADPRDYGTDRESALYCPVGGNVAGAPSASTNASVAGKDDKALADYYHRLGSTLAARQVSLDVFICNALHPQQPPEFVDLATLGKLTHMTAGRLHLFKGPIATPSNTRRFASLAGHALTRRVAHEAVLKVRTSVGLSLRNYVSPGVVHMAEELEMAIVDEDHTFLAELQHDGERIKEGSKVYIQLALLFTSPEGQRTVRVHNLQLQTASAVSSVFRYADMEAVYSYLAKHAAWQAWAEPLQRVREGVTRQCVDMLYQYRQHCAASSPPGQLILPESLKLLPLYALALLKSDALRLNPPEAGRAHGQPDPTADERAWALHFLLGGEERGVVHATYPRLYEIVGAPGCPPPSFVAALMAAQQQGGVPPTPGSGGAPPAIAASGPISLHRLHGCSSESLGGTGLFLLDAWNALYLYVGREVSVDGWRELFGLEGLPPEAHAQGFHIEVQPGSDAGAHLLAAIDGLCALDRSPTGPTRRPPVVVIGSGSGSAAEAHFVKLLVDDRQKDAQSYVEYLCLVHKQIQNRLAGRA